MMGNSTVEKICILSGIYNVFATKSAGIGAGRAKYGWTSVTELLIYSGSFKINVNYGSAIGSGYAENGTDSVSRIEIWNGSFEITGLQYSSGIGSGYAYFGNTTVESIRIHDGIFRIKTERAAGIGAGFSWNGISLVEYVHIENGSFNLRNRKAAAIGTSFALSGNSIVHNLVICNGSINAIAELAIGSTPDAQVNNLQIGGCPNSTTFSLHCIARTRWCVWANNISIKDIDLIGMINTPNFIRPNTNGIREIDLKSLELWYGGILSPENFGSLPILRFKRFEFPQPADIVLLRIDTQETSRVLHKDTNGIFGLAVSVPDNVEYSIETLDDETSFCSKGNSVFQSSTSGQGYETLEICGASEGIVKVPHQSILFIVVLPTVIFIINWLCFKYLRKKSRRFAPEVNF
jgi:hypothetical protein